MHCFPPEANALTWLERRGELVALKMQLCYMRSTAQHSTAQHSTAQTVPLCNGQDAWDGMDRVTFCDQP